MNLIHDVDGERELSFTRLTQCVKRESPAVLPPLEEEGPYGINSDFFVYVFFRLLIYFFLMFETNFINILDGHVHWRTSDLFFSKFVDEFDLWKSYRTPSFKGPTSDVLG